MMTWEWVPRQQDSFGRLCFDDGQASATLVHHHRPSESHFLGAHRLGKGPEKVLELLVVMALFVQLGKTRASILQSGEDTRHLWWKAGAKTMVVVPG